jgi:hypothetical protein
LQALFKFQLAFGLKIERIDPTKYSFACMGKREMKGGGEDEAKGNQSSDGYFHSDISLVVEKI